jgi:hypothetical protein
MIGLDNNAAERALRRPVVTRKNAYGSRNGDAARIAARAWTVTATAEMADLNVLTYLTAYLDACGHNGGKPLTSPDLEPIPALGSRPRRPARLGTATPPRLNPRKQSPRRRHAVGHAARQYAHLQDFRILTVKPLPQRCQSHLLLDGGCLAPPELIRVGNRRSSSHGSGG